MLEGGSLKGYDIKVPLAYVLPDGCYLINEAGQHVSLWGFGSSGNTVTVRRALNSVGGGRTGTMPFGRNLLPFAPSAVPEDGVETPTKITAAWYKQDGTPLADAEMKLSETGYVYDGGSEKAAFQAYDGMSIGSKYDLFMVLTAADEKGAELWQAVVTGYELTIDLPTLDDAEIAFTGGSEAVFDPNDSTSVPAFTVTLYGETVDKAHCTVSGDTADRVGTYTLTVSGDGTHYAGSATAQWTVQPYKLSGMELDATVTRKYDGTTEVPDGVFTGRFQSAENAGQTVTLTADAYKVTAANYNTANVGGGKTVTYTVELLNTNYVFENGTDTQTFAAAAAELLKAGQTITAADITAAYGDTDKKVIYTGTLYGDVTYAVKSGSGVVEVDSATGALKFLKAGDAVITVSAAGDNDHDPAAKDVAVEVSKRSLTIRALDRAAYAGDAAPGLTSPTLGTDYEITGLVGSDAVTVENVRMSYAPELDMTRTGTYGIHITADLAADERYALNCVPGTLTVTTRLSSGGSASSVNTPSKTENGSVGVSSKNASKGDTVTITVEPDDGFELADLIVTDKDGNRLEVTDQGDGKYTFTMPAGKVDIKASFTEQAEVGPFDDVAGDAYYCEAVKWAQELGITDGVGNGLFGPEQSCTRAQIVTFLWRAAGSPEPKIMSGFADVPAASYYARAVAWAVENGITAGTSGAAFSPDATCSRAQAVTFLARALNAQTSGAAEFTDVPADSYFAGAVA